MSLVIHEARYAPLPIAPAQTCAVAQSRQGFDADELLRAGVNDRMEGIQDIGARDGLDILVKIIGPGDAGIPGAVIAKIDVVAGVPIDAFDVEKSRSDRAAVADPIDVRFLTDVYRAAAIIQSGRNHRFERRPEVAGPHDRSGRTCALRPLSLFWGCKFLHHFTPFRPVLARASSPKSATAGIHRIQLAIAVLA